MILLRFVVVTNIILKTITYQLKFGEDRLPPQVGFERVKGCHEVVQVHDHVDNRVEENKNNSLRS